MVVAMGWWWFNGSSQNVRKNKETTKKHIPLTRKTRSGKLLGNGVGPPPPYDHTSNMFVGSMVSLCTGQLPRPVADSLSGGQPAPSSHPHTIHWLHNSL